MTFNNSTGFTQIQTDNGISQVSVDKPNFAIKGINDVSSSAVGRRINLNAAQIVSDNSTNLGIAYDSQTGEFRMVSANGSDLSPLNKGIIEMRRSQTLNDSVIFEIDKPFRFHDVIGGSDLTGRNFGTWQNVGWPEPMPFFIYLIVNDSYDDFSFGICRQYGRRASPQQEVISTRTTPTSSNFDFAFHLLDFFDGSSFVSPNKSEYQTNSAVPIGFFTMTKNSSDEWTVDPLSLEVGIDLEVESKRFNYPLGVNGAASGSFFKADSGQSIVFSENNYVYSLSGSVCYCDISLSGALENSNSLRNLFTAPMQTESFIEINGIYSVFDNADTFQFQSEIKATSTSTQFYNLNRNETSQFSGLSMPTGGRFLGNMKYPLLGAIP